MRTLFQYELDWLVAIGVLREENDSPLRRYIPSSRFKDYLAKNLSDLEETEYEASEALNKAVLKAVIEMAGGLSDKDHEKLYVCMNILLNILPTKKLAKRVNKDIAEVRMNKFKRTRWSK